MCLYNHYLYVHETGIQNIQHNPQHGLKLNHEKFGAYKYKTDMNNTICTSHTRFTNTTANSAYANNHKSFTAYLKRKETQRRI